MNNFKKTSITIEESDFEEFKRFAKLRNSDGAKEIRKLIKKYNQDSKKIFKDTEEEIEK